MRYEIGKNLSQAFYFSKFNFFSITIRTIIITIKKRFNE